MRIVNNVSLRVKLPFITVSLCTLAIVAVGTVSYLDARAFITDEAKERLRGIAELQAERTSEFFDRIDRDLTLRASESITQGAVIAFSQGFTALEQPRAQLQKRYIDDNPHPLGEKDKYLKAQDGDFYDLTHGRFHRHFDQLQDAHDYYDVFLFDTEGNLIYSVFKERDFATNMNTGEWSDTGLARVFTRAMNAPVDSAGQIVSVFDDFAPYGPSAGAPASFIARPVLGADGARIGVLAYQMPIDELNQTLASVDGIGETGLVYLLGTDGLLRTDVASTEVMDVLETRMDLPQMDEVLAGTASMLVAPDLLNRKAQHYAAASSFLGTKWVLVASESIEELVKPTVLLLNHISIQTAIVLGLAIVGSLFFARGLSRPLIKVGAAMHEIGNNRFDTEVPASKRGDEIGIIARELEAFRQSLQEAEALSRAATFKGAGFDLSGAPMIVCDKNLSVIYHNKAMHRLVTERLTELRTEVPELDPEKLIGFNIDGFSGVIGEPIVGALAPNKLPMRRKLRFDNVFIGVLFDAVLDDNGEVIAYVGEWRDQTFQMSAQAVQQAVDSAQCRIEIGLSGRIKAANSSFSNLVGRAAETLKNEAADTYLSLVGAEETFGSVLNSVASGQARFVALQVETSSGTHILEGSLNPLPDDKGGVVGFILIAIDVTEQRAIMARAEHEQKKMAQEQLAVVNGLRLGLDRLSQGDLSARIGVAFAEEYEGLRNDFNATAEALSQAMTLVTTSASSVNSDAIEILDSVSNLSSRTTAQASTLERTAAALGELTVSVQSTASGASDTSELVGQVREQADAGGTVVRGVVDAMGRIEKSSERIARITGVIDDIAFQTNLLALNAGVEAARAGDAGRGFAVVASEVRALAQRSADAAREINDLVSSSEAQVQEGSTLVNQAGDALDGIVASIREAVRHVSEIAQSASEQSRTLADINDSVNSLDKSTQDNAAMANETTNATQALAEEAKVMVEATSKFALSDQNEGTNRVAAA